MLLTCFYIPWFTLAFVAIILIVIVIDWTMHHGVKETKRLDNQLKAPVIHHITSSMAGIVTIRAFQKEEVFLQRFNRFLNTSTSADSLFRLSTRWFMWRMETMALVAITLTSVFCVGFKVNRRIEVFCFNTHYFILFQSFVSPAVAGLVMINVFQAAVAVPFVMQLKAAFLAYINSLERNFQYILVCPRRHLPRWRREEGDKAGQRWVALGWRQSASDTGPSCHLCSGVCPSTLVSACS